MSNNRWSRWFNIISYVVYLIFIQIKREKEINYLSKAWIWVFSKICKTSNALNLTFTTQVGSTIRIGIPLAYKKGQLSGWLAPESLANLEVVKGNPIPSPQRVFMRILCYNGSPLIARNPSLLSLSLARASCVVWGMHVCSQKEGWNEKGVTFLVPCWCSFVGERNNFSILKSHSIFLSFFLLKGYCLVILLYEAMSHEGGE